MTTLKIMIIIGVTSMCWWRKNFIILLLSLELILSSLFTLLSMSMFNIPMFPFLSMLCIMVSGSSLGLTLMVSLCRFFKSPNSLPIWLLK